MPEEFVRIHRLASQGRWEEARLMQAEVNRVIRTAIAYPLLPAVKAILAWMDVDCGPCLPPRRVLTRQQAAELRAGLLATCVEPALVHHQPIAG